MATLVPNCAGRNTCLHLSKMPMEMHACRSSINEGFKHCFQLLKIENGNIVCCHNMEKGCFQMWDTYVKIPKASNVTFYKRLAWFRLINSLMTWGITQASVSIAVAVSWCLNFSKLTIVMNSNRCKNLYHPYFSYCIQTNKLICGSDSRAGKNMSMHFLPRLYWTDVIIH